MSSSRSKKPANPGRDAGDAATVKELLVWARRTGFAISALTVGSISLAVTDIAQPETPGARGSGDDPFRRYGGPLADRLEKLKQDAERDPLQEDPDPDGLGVG